MESDIDDTEKNEKQRPTVSGDAKDDETEGNWLNEVLTKDAA